MYFAWVQHILKLKKKNAIWNAPTVSGTSSGVCELTNQSKTEKEYSAAALGNMR